MPTDTCYILIKDFRTIAEMVARSLEYYQQSPYSHFSDEHVALQRASIAAAKTPCDPEALVRLIRLAASILADHGVHLPDASTAEQEVKMTRLVEPQPSRDGNHGGDLDSQEKALTAACTHTDMEDVEQLAERIRRRLGQSEKSQE